MVREPSELVFTLAGQSDGKILMGGCFAHYDGAASPYGLRLNADGSLDTTFSMPLQAAGVVMAFQQLSNGEILAGGLSDASTGGMVLLTSEGKFDLGFNMPNGTVGAMGPVYTFRVLSDGTILVGGGVFTHYDANSIQRSGITKLLANGLIDSTFSSGGGTDDIVRTIVPLPDGKILIGGQFTTYNGVSRERIARLNSDGSLDTTITFPSFTGALLGGTNCLMAIVPLSDGKLLVGGNFSDVGSVNRSCIARLNADGTVDTSFPAGGTGTGANASVTDIELLADGKILICGAFTSYNGTNRNCIARLNADGSPDQSFLPVGAGPGGSGNIILNTMIWTMLPLADGRIVVGGNFKNYDGVERGFVARIWGDSLRFPAPQRVEIGHLAPLIVLPAVVTSTSPRRRLRDGRYEPSAG